MHHRVTRTARARRRSGGQKRPSRAFLERGRVPDGAPEKAATNVAAFLLHHSLRDGLELRARRTTARAVLRRKMEALQADKRTGLNS